MSTERFSTLSFLSQRRQYKLEQQDIQKISNLFNQICDELRQYLVSLEGYSSDEKTRYTEQLIQAVLGFSAARASILTIIEDRLAKLHIELSPTYYDPYPTLAEAVFAEIVGLNVLEIVMKQYDQLEEIQVVGLNIFVVVKGKVLPTTYHFQHLKEVERIQQNLVLYNNDMINFDKRWAEVMLQNGARVTLTGFGFTSVPTLTIRFYTVKHIDLRELAQSRYQMMPEVAAQWLRELVEKRLNVVIIGQTNSGKTNLLKALVAEMPMEERIITIESRLEMMLKRDYPSRNIVEYEVSYDSKDSRHDANQAFKLALRQSPERIIHAEIRDDDANIYVRACTRGHRGSMTTVHANHLEDVPDIIVDMCMLDKRSMDTERLLKRVTRYVAQVGIQLAIVQGRRIIKRLVFYEWQNNHVVLHNVLVFKPETHNWTVNESIFREQLQVFEGRS